MNPLFTRLDGALESLMGDCNLMAAFIGLHGFLLKRSRVDPSLHFIMTRLRKPRLNCQDVPLLTFERCLINFKESPSHSQILPPFFVLFIP